jgi:sugar phosphate isomerase/epimerase
VRIALSEISTVAASFADDVAAYGAAGFDGIGIWEFKLPEGDDDASVRLVRESGLGVANCVPAIPTFLQLAQAGMEGPADPAERIEALCASIARLARFEPASIVVLTGPVGDRSEAEARAIVCDGLRQAAAAARAAGVRLGLEPTHISESHVTSFISTIGEAIALLDEAGVGDVGVMVDTVHVWDTPALAEEVERHAARVTGFHVGDKAAASDPSRLLPGEGVTRPEELARMLRATGFDGYLDVEIFSTPDAFWGLPVDEAARRAAAAAHWLIAQS